MNIVGVANIQARDHKYVPQFEYSTGGVEIEPAFEGFDAGTRDTVAGRFGQYQININRGTNDKGGFAIVSGEETDSQIGTFATVSDCSF